MKKVVYPVLGAVMAQRSISQRTMAESMGITESALSYKLHNGRKFTVDEAIKIQEALFPDIPVNELFKRS